MNEKKFECFRCGGTRGLVKVAAGLICYECRQDVEICDHCKGVIGEGEAGRCPLCGGP